MCAVAYKTGEPYKLGGSRIVFTNWYYVRLSSFGWYDDEGKGVSVIGSQGPYDAHIKRFNHAWGVKLSVKNPVRTGPVIKAKCAWENDGAGITTILKENGVYRAWGSTGWGDLDKGRKFFCYYESKDGMNWERPACGIIEYEGSRDNNLLMEGSGGTVFIDPSAPANERYKWISEHAFASEEYEEYKKRRPDAVDYKCERRDVGLLIGAQGAVSPDGIHWEVIKQPLVMMHTDTQVVAYYDSVLKKYVGYFRDWMVGPQDESVQDEKRKRWLAVGRRVIGRAETDDFRNFPLSEVILEPRLDMGPGKVLYTNCKTTVPGAPDIHLMFPAVWNGENDTTSIEMASSHDGRVWNYLSDKPILDTAEFGQWDGGCVFALPNLVELSNGDFALPYTGYDVPHKYPRVKATRAMGYALWPRGRMVALEAAQKGEFATVSFIPQGNRLLINAVTKRAGRILVEAADLDGNPIPGMEFENSMPVTGDCYRTPVVWKGHEDLGIQPGQAVSLRFKMEEASIYSLDFAE